MNFNCYIIHFYCCLALEYNIKKISKCYFSKEVIASEEMPFTVLLPSEAHYSSESIGAIQM